MDLGRYKLPGTAALVLDAATVDRMLAMRDGDAALLYLYLLRCNGAADGIAAAETLGWKPERVERAFTMLTQAGLLGCETPPEAAAPPPAQDSPPDYTSEEIAEEMKRDNAFPALVGDVESRLGRVLSVTDLKILYGLYDHLQLPPEVISLLVTYCKEECQRQFGAGRMPRMRQIEKEGYRWHRQGAVTLERAVHYLKAQNQRRSKERQILAALGITDRSPVPSEQRYIDEWLDMGFSPEAVSIAYDRTVLKTGALKWPYLNSILKSWHQKGLHTPEEIETGDGSSAAPPRRTADAAASNREAIAWMREYVKNKRSESGK